MRPYFALLIALCFTQRVLGHFVYVVPDASRGEALVVFSETPAADEKVSVDRIAGTELFAIDAAGGLTRVPTEKSDHVLRAELPAGTVLVSGATQYGVANSRHTGNIPVRIQYLSKAVLGDLSRASEITTRQNVPLEIMPVVREGKLEFFALSGGKPVADADCAVVLPGSDKGERGKTSADGRLPGRFDRPGRYGAWVRIVDLKPGQWQGTAYDKSHTYATLTVDLPAGVNRP